MRQRVETGDTKSAHILSQGTYSTYFNDSLPAREAVCVAALPLGASVEISVIAELLFSSSFILLVFNTLKDVETREILV